MDHEETWELLEEPPPTTKQFSVLIRDQHATLRKPGKFSRVVKAAGQTEKKKQVAAKILDPNLGNPKWL